MSPVLTVLLVVLVVLVVAAVAIVVVRMVRGGEASPEFAVDQPIEAPSYDHPDTDGGPLGAAMTQAFEGAGFGCVRQDGERDVFVYCHRSQADPAPTVQRIRMTMRGKQVLSIAADVRPDPAYAAAGERIDVRPAASPVFGPIAGYAKYVMTADDAAQFEKAIGQAVDGEHAEFDLSKGKGYFDITAEKAKLYFTPDFGSAQPGPGLPDGLESLTPLELENAAESVGASCEPRTEDSTTSSCRSGKVRLEIGFPVPKLNADLNIDPVPGARDRWVRSIRITGPASSDGSPDPAMIELASALSGAAGEKYGDAATPRDWAKNCFGGQTNQSVFGYSEASCQPVLAGDRQPTEFRFEIGPIPTW